MKVLDLDLPAAGSDEPSGDLDKTSSTVFPAGATESDHFRAGGQECVVDQVVDELACSGGVDDDFLHAGMKAVQVEDVAGGGRVFEPVTDVFNAVGGGGNRPPFGISWQVQVAERDQP
ncbi:hypothetical protein OG320_04265 [Microbispora sp. NBC_01189]|nr:hypothetical protein OG320_04265 [Microbispora sp. NBC_01189]